MFICLVLLEMEGFLKVNVYGRIWYIVGFEGSLVVSVRLFVFEYCGLFVKSEGESFLLCRVRERNVFVFYFLSLIFFKDNYCGFLVVGD